MKEVIERQGVFCALYSDRGSHFSKIPCNHMHSGLRN
jgi:hypothetical protein